MGSSGSKAAKTAAGAAQRRYPSRPSAPTSAQQQSNGQASIPPRPQNPSQDAAMPRDDSGPSMGTMTSARAGKDDSSRRSAPPPPPPTREQRQASGSRDQGIDLDGRDPQLAAHLRTLGPVQPNPTYSPSSRSSPTNTVTSNTVSGASSAPPTGPGVPSTTLNTVSSNPATTPSPRNNPALAILSARQRIQDEQERDRVDAGKSGWQGRRYVDVGTLRKVLVLRDEQGMRAEEVEKVLGLRKGFVEGLGRQGVIEAS